MAINLCKPLAAYEKNKLTNESPLAKKTDLIKDTINN